MRHEDCGFHRHRRHGQRHGGQPDQGRLSSGRERSQPRAGQADWRAKAHSSRTRPKQWPKSCELVLSMLPNNDAVRAVGLGKGGLAEATTGAKVWIDFSSIDKETIVGVSDELTRRAGPSSTLRPAASRRSRRPVSWRFGCRAPRRCSTSSSRYSRRWANRFCMSASSAMPSWSRTRWPCWPPSNI